MISLIILFRWSWTQKAVAFVNKFLSFEKPLTIIAEDKLLAPKFYQ